MFIRYLLVLVFTYCSFSLSANATCQAPQSLYVSSLTYQSARISWNYYDGTSVPTTFQVQWRPVGTPNWNTDPVVTTASSSLTGLTNNTFYEWRVRTVCSVGDTSSFSSPTTFQTQCNNPFGLSISNLTHQSAQLNWYSSVGGAMFEIRWRLANTANWTVIGGLTSGRLTLNGLPEDTSIEWQVRTLCAATTTSDFVDGPNFRTSCLPPTSPRTTLTSADAAELTWVGQETGAHFDLQWRIAGRSAWHLETGISINEFTLTGLTNNTTYEWQVRTACSATSTSAFTDIQLFQTGCPAPTNLVSSTTYNAAVLQWTAALASNLQWRVAGATNWMTAQSVRTPYSLTGLLNNTNYEWRVSTVCSATASSDYTASQLLVTQCAQPTYLTATPNQVGGIDLSWSYSMGRPFEVQWRVAGTTSWSVATNITSSYYTLTGLSLNTNYEWRVRQVCSATDLSDFTDGPTTQTFCSTPSEMSAGNTTASSIDLTWSAAESTARYEIQWRPSNTTNWTTISDITTNRYTLQNLPTNASYEWRLRKFCSPSVVSYFSVSQTFSLYCSQPTYFTASEVGTSYAKVVWGYYNTYAPYELQYRPFGTTDWITIPGLTTMQYSLTGLTNNTTYEWRVRSSCPTGGPADFAATQTFQTQCGQPFSNLNVQRMSASSAELHWTNGAFSNLYELQYREVTTANWTVLQPEGLETDPTYGKSAVNAEKYYTLYGLTPGKTYEWRVRIRCTAGIYSEFASGTPFTATCRIPYVYGNQLTNRSIALYWQDSLASRFDLQYRIAGTSDWTTLAGLTGSSYTLTNLSPGNAYEYRIRQICSGTTYSDYSNIAYTELRCQAPYSQQATTLSATTVRLSWAYDSEIPDNSLNLPYELQYRVSGTSGWTVVSGIVGRVYSLTGLVSGTTYEWQVQAMCTPGLASGYSGSAFFTPSCSAIYSGYTSLPGTTSARLSWTSPSYDNAAYLLQWRLAGTASWSTVTVHGNDQTVSYALTGLTNNTAYEWKLAPDCGAESVIQAFQTGCGAIVSLTARGIGSHKAELSWSNNNLLTESTYRVQYRISGTVIWSDITGLTMQQVSLTGLASKTTYEWRVQAICSPDIAASFSPVSTFQTQCANPTDVNSFSVTAQSALLTWSNNDENSPVDLQWRPYSSSTSNITWNEATGLTSQSYSLTGLTPDTYYIYRLRSVCATDDPAPYQEYAVFTSPLSALSVFVNSLSAQTAYLSWTNNNGLGNGTYVVQWQVQNSSWNTSGQLTALAYVLSDLLPNTAYNVRVGYVNSDGSVTYGYSTSFTTYCPSATNLLATNVLETSASVTWTGVNVPVSVQWRVGGATQWTSATGIVSNSYTLTNLVANTSYQWRIVSSCQADVTTPTAPATFQTSCLMPTNTVTQHLASRSAQLAWTGYGQSFSVRYRMAGADTWTTVPAITGNTYSLTGLTNNTIYEWAVARVCESGSPTDYTSPIRFQTQCNLPSFTYVDPFTFQKVLFLWNGNETSYLLRWRVAGSSVWNEIPAVTSPYTLTGLVDGTTYEWQLKSECNDGFVNGDPFLSQCPTNFYTFNYGEYSERITASTARLVWSYDAQLTYVLRWRVAGSSMWNEIPSVTSPYTLTGLTNNTSYEWQLRINCQPTYNALQLFRTNCESPLSLKTTMLTTKSATLSWADSPEGVSYEVQWRIAGTTAWNSVGGLTSNTYSLTGLTAHTAYEWQVRSQCTGGSAFRATVSFITVDDCMSGTYTLHAGSWDDPGIWSCQRVPTQLDSVQLKHTITIPDAYAAKAMQISYDQGTKLIFGTKATIQIQQ